MITDKFMRLFLFMAGALTLLFAVLFAVSPEAGLNFVTHRPEQLTEVMAGRYLALTLFAFAIALWGDLRMVAAFFGIGAMLGLIDGYIYASEGFSHWRHTSVGVLSLIGMIATLWLRKQQTA